MKTVVFYDNLCSVCNYWVNWILENDNNEFFYFAALESEFAVEFSNHFKCKFPKETIVVWNERAGFSKKSNAVIVILQTLKPSSFQLIALRIFPKFLRDAGYSFFAYFRRYIQMRDCKIPTSKDKQRFLTGSSFKNFLNK